MNPLKEPVPGAVCLFLHIPKTAGTTLKHCLYNQYAVPGESGGCFHDGVYYFPYGFHKTPRPTFTDEVRATFARDDLRVVTGHYWYGAHAFVPRPSFYITLLRDPVDRVASLYYHIVATRREVHHEAIVSRRTTLLEFVGTFACREVDNDQTRRIAGEEPEFGACTPGLLERAKGHLRERFAFVGTTERFDESLIALKRLLGWPEVAYVPGLVNENRVPKEALAPEVVEAIVERNEYDLELYEYANGLLDERLESEEPSFLDELERLRAENPAYIARATGAA